MISQEMPIRSANRPADEARLAFLYEHPHWFAQIFAELERRRVPFEKIFIPEHFYDVGATQPAFKVLFNRMSPSADGRQHGSGIFHSLAYLEHLERQGIRVLNGAQAFRYEISKASQASLLKSLNLRFIPSRVIHAANQAVAAAAGLRYPIFGITWLTRWSMTAACAPKLEVSTCAPGSSSVAFSIRSSVEKDSNAALILRRALSSTRSPPPISH
jgi:hypothetical protein